MKHLEIIKAGINDVFHLQEISILTFTESFSSFNTEENMKSYLENNFSTDKLKVQLADQNCAYYFAKTDQKTVGYLKINLGSSQTELQEENALEIERIYVLKEFQGKKAGQRLLEKAIQIARELEVEFVWLGVWDANQGAIRFYQKNGFEEFDRHIFLLGEEVQTDIMMRLSIL